MHKEQWQALPNSLRQQLFSDFEADLEKAQGELATQTAVNDMLRKQGEIIYLRSKIASLKRLAVAKVE